MNTTYDVVIVGGGLVGSYAAYRLSQHSLRVAIVEAKEAVTSNTKFDLRVSAITAANQRMFDNDGLWTAMCASVTPGAFREMHVWDESGRGELHFDSADIGEPTLGYIIENRVMQQTFTDAISTQANIDKFSPALCNSLQINDEGVQLGLSTGEQLKAKLILGADGSQSWLRKTAGIAVRGWDYDHHALVTYVKTEKSHQETAAQRFLTTGPLAFLPLNEAYSSIVWSTSPDEAARLKDLPESEFKAELAQAFEQRMGAIETIGPRAVYPLRFFMTDAYVQPHLALLGDAAHTVHPLAGQGVNLGFADVNALDTLIAQALSSTKAIDDFVLLRKYERARKADNLPMLVAVDSFQRLFGSQLTTLQLLRNTGMRTLNKITPLKNAIIQQAMGL